MKKVLVVNKTNHAPTDNDYYIGRGSVLGNPYTSKDVNNSMAIYQSTSREASIESYRDYLKDKIDSNDIPIMNMINMMLETLKTSDINLVCYCKPKDCHGDVIKTYLVSKQIGGLMRTLIKK